VTNIFVSYAREDLDQVEQLSNELARAGYHAFYDGDITGGQAWWEMLLTEIEECDVFAPAISNSYLASKPCGAEANYAIALRKPLVPIKLEPINPGLLREEVGNAQWVPYDATDHSAQTLAVIRAVNGASPAPPLPETMPPRPHVPVSYVISKILAILDQEELSIFEQRGVLGEIAVLRGEDQAQADMLLHRFLERPDLFHQVVVEANAQVQGLSQSQQPAAPGPEPSTVTPPFPSAPQRVPSPPAPFDVPIKRHLWWSAGLVVAGFFGLFVPSIIGLVALVAGVSVGRRSKRGDCDGALRASRLTRWLIWIGLITEILGVAGFILINLGSHTG
jgi:hypothetical protein